MFCQRCRPHMLAQEESEWPPSAPPPPPKHTQLRSCCMSTLNGSFSLLCFITVYELKWVHQPSLEDAFSRTRIHMSIFIRSERKNVKSIQEIIFFRIARPCWTSGFYFVIAVRYFKVTFCHITRVFVILSNCNVSKYFDFTYRMTCSLDEMFLCFGMDCCPWLIFYYCFI